SAGVQTLDVALRASDVVEVLGDRDWIPIPGARRETPGVVIWSGRAIAVLDLSRFGRGLDVLRPNERRARVLVVTSEGGHVAIPVDRIGDIVRTHDDNVRPRQLHDFELSRDEILLGDTVLPLFESELLLARLGAGASQ